MAKRWISTKTWTTEENSSNKYLISGSNGACNYQTIPVGATKKTLQWNSVGNLSYTNLNIPVNADVLVNKAYHFLTPKGIETSDEGPDAWYYLNHSIQSIENNKVNLQYESTSVKYFQGDTMYFAFVPLVSEIAGEEILTWFKNHVKTIEVQNTRGNTKTIAITKYFYHNEDFPYNMIPNSVKAIELGVSQTGMWWDDYTYSGMKYVKFIIA